MTTLFNRVRIALVAGVIGAMLCMPGTVQAHEELAGRWKEKDSDGKWYLDFEKGVANDMTYSGTWSGNCHHTKKMHSGVYVLVMKNKVQGTLTMYENVGGKDVVLATAEVHLGEHHLTYGNAHYHKK